MYPSVLSDRQPVPLPAEGVGRGMVCDVPIGPVQVIMQGTNLEQHSHVWYVVIQGRVDMCVRCAPARPAPWLPFCGLSAGRGTGCLSESLSVWGTCSVRLGYGAVSDGSLRRVCVWGSGGVRIQLDLNACVCLGRGRTHAQGLTYRMCSFKVAALSALSSIPRLLPPPSVPPSSIPLCLRFSKAAALPARPALVPRPREEAAVDSA